MEIKCADKKDFQGIYRLWIKAGLAISCMQREQVEYEMLLAVNPKSCLVAIEGKEIIGVVLGAFNGRRAWIYHLAVHPNCQGQGIGKQLVDKVEIALQELGATKIILGVHVNNLEIVPFYQKLGFQVMYDAVLFEKDLYVE